MPRLNIDFNNTTCNGTFYSLDFKVVSLFSTFYLLLLKRRTNHYDILLECVYLIVTTVSKDRILDKFKLHSNRCHFINN